MMIIIIIIIIILTEKGHARHCAHRAVSASTNMKVQKVHNGQ
jgi:hypothetical protein